MISFTDQPYVDAILNMLMIIILIVIVLAAIEKWSNR